MWDMASAVLRRKLPRAASAGATRRRNILCPAAITVAPMSILSSAAPASNANAAHQRQQVPRPGAAAARFRCPAATATSTLVQVRPPRRRLLAAHLTKAAASHASAGSGGADQAAALTVTARVVVPYRPTSHGQRLVLVGGCEALGNWDPTKGVAFTWCEGHSHVAEVELPIHTPIACKLVLLGGGGGEGAGGGSHLPTSWEPEADRELLLAPSSLAARAAGYTVFCHWGFPDCTPVLANSLRRGGGAGAASRSGSGSRSGSAGRSGGAQRSSDNPLIAGVKKALAHASSRAERFAVIPGITSSWEEDGGAAVAAAAVAAGSFDEAEEEALPVQCQVTVLVPRTGPKLRPDQSLVLVGSCLALGRWDPAQGLPLERADEESPMWTAQAELPLGEGLQAKVVVVDGVSGQAQVWEPCENRSLERVGGGGSRPVMITAYWGTAATHCMEVDRLSPAAAATSPQVVTLLRQQLAATSTQVDGLRRERDEARRAVAASEAHLKQLEGEVKSLDRGGGGGAGAGRQEMVQLAEQLSTTRRLYEVTKQEAMELGGSVGVTRQLCDAAKRELTGLASQLEAAKRAYEALAPQVERMERQLAATSRAFDATKPELQALEAQLERARSLFDRTLAKIEAAKALSAASGGVEFDSTAVRRRGEAGAGVAARVREMHFVKG